MAPPLEAQTRVADQEAVSWLRWAASCRERERSPLVEEMAHFPEGVEVAEDALHLRTSLATFQVNSWPTAELVTWPAALEQSIPRRPEVRQHRSPWTMPAALAQVRH